MKSLRAILVVLFVSIASSAMAEKVANMPAPTEYVDDYAGVMTVAGKTRVEAICHEVHLKTKAQIFVVTIKTLEDASIKEFANDLFHKWKIGEKKTDRGILVLFVADHHRWRIEVGYGLEGILPDAEAGRIGRAMDPSIKAGDYDEAAMIGVRPIAAAIAQDANVTLATLSDSAPVQPLNDAPPSVAAAPSSSEIGAGSWAIAILFLCFFGVFGLIVWASIRNRRRMIGGGPGYYDTSSSGPTFMGYGGSDSSGSSSSDSSGGFFSSDSSSSFGGDSFSGGDGGDSGGGGADGGGDGGSSD
jgi:uncharacterized protein